MPGVMPRQACMELWERMFQKRRWGPGLVCCRAEGAVRAGGRGWPAGPVPELGLWAKPARRRPDRSHPAAPFPRGLVLQAESPAKVKTTRCSPGFPCSRPCPPTWSRPTNQKPPVSLCAGREPGGRWRRGLTESPIRGRAVPGAQGGAAARGLVEWPSEALRPSLCPRQAPECPHVTAAAQRRPAPERVGNARAQTRPDPRGAPRVRRTQLCGVTVDVRQKAQLVTVLVCVRVKPSPRSERLFLCRRERGCACLQRAGLLQPRPQHTEVTRVPPLPVLCAPGELRAGCGAGSLSPCIVHRCLSPQRQREGTQEWEEKQACRRAGSPTQDSIPGH
ncbi:uncharacterized protein LOC125081715 isoform X1 [Lutra lutra]|uniref:uncharacterized protein LOC125081715 isoform X1 n=1 Tax=Lutra lutra TaxID=9657 RepID=UPI001FD497C2|nr:uncharacterized protein LOC125081715 isoform X1 [Lutra lutra]